MENGSWKMEIGNAKWHGTYRPRWFLYYLRSCTLIKEVTMLGVVADHLKDVSVLRCLLFVATYLPRELPNFWGIAVEFATAGKVKRNAITPEMAEAIVENIHSIDANAFCTDKTVHQELIGWDLGNGKALGVVLISSEKQCVLCGSKLTLRRDRPSSM